MIITEDKKYIKALFVNEAEIETVVINNYEYLFGPSSIYLPKALIKTGDGVGTIPDGFAIDLSARKWYLVEAELISHSVWSHIAPQVTKQMIASQQQKNKKILEDLAVDMYQNDYTTKEKFSELGIKEINVRKILSEILEKEPVVGVPIDSVSNDLRDWARTLKYNVKLWIITKYVEFSSPNNIAYEFPEEFKPALDTEKEEEQIDNSAPSLLTDIGILDLISAHFLNADQKLVMIYKPRNGAQKKYVASIQPDGSMEVLGNVYSSPSYAALAGIQDAGSLRKTVNGWTSWKTEDGITIAELRNKLIIP
ncbi:MAG: hypothetical protein WCR72_13025 [Bacteroidota bacterium]